MLVLLYLKAFGTSRSYLQINICVWICQYLFKTISINFLCEELEASVFFIICLLEKNISVMKGDMSIDKAQHNFGFQAEVRLNCNLVQRIERRKQHVP